MIKRKTTKKFKKQNGSLIRRNYSNENNGSGYELSLNGLGLNALTPMEWSSNLMDARGRLMISFFTPTF
jgi:hypothetical protein